MASGKWSWRYRVSLDRLSAEQMRAVWDFCNTKFGSDAAARATRWDLSFIKRRINPDSWFPRYYYTRVKVHFKSQEDQVLFKLTYEPPEV